MAVYELVVDGTLVLQRGVGMNAMPPAGFIVSIESFERDYEGASKLVIRLEGDWRRPPWRADRPVLLWRDSVLVFKGLLDLPQPIASAAEHPGLVYRACDISRVLDRVNAQTKLIEHDPPSADEPRKPMLELRGGKLSDLVDALLAEIDEDLAAYGVSAEVAYIGGAEHIETFPVSIRFESIDRVMRKLAGSAPGVRVFLDPSSGTPTYTFVNLFESPTYDVEIDDRLVESLQITQTVDGRYGAVSTQEGSTQGTADFAFDDLLELGPAWDTNLEKDWSRQDADTLDSDMQRSAMADVFRKWTWVGVSGNFTPEGVQREPPSGGRKRAFYRSWTDFDSLESRWEPVTIIQIDFENKFIITDQPILLPVQATNRFGFGRRNQFEPGRSRAGNMRLASQQAQATSATITLRATRFPEVGFSGRAYQLAPITCGTEKQVEIPGGVDRTRYARFAHAALSEPLVQGSIPLNEDLPAELWSLGRRINLRSVSHGPIGWENLLAPIMGVRVRFDRGGGCELEFNRDTSALLVEGGS